MTDETPIPKRKRWRRIVAGVLLFVVAVAGWQMLRAKIDRRFVGRWIVADTDPAPPDLTVDFTFVADGTGTVAGLPIAWSVSRNRLVIENRPERAMEKLKRLFGLGIEDTFIFEPYAILDVGTDTIRLVPLGEAGNRDSAVLLTRAPQ
jgi:hypothetical protein